MVGKYERKEKKVMYLNLFANLVIATDKIIVSSCASIQRLTYLYKLINKKINLIYFAYLCYHLPFFINQIELCV